MAKNLLYTHTDMDRPIITVKEARKLLGKSANAMSDEEVAETINTLDLMAKDALQSAKHRLAMKSDAHDLAQLIYDVYREEKN